MTNILKNEGFLELITVADIKIKKKLIARANEEEIESILDCFASIEPYAYRLKKCKRKFEKFKKFFKGKAFTIKKARALFQKNLQFVASVIAIVLSEILNKQINTVFGCEDERTNLESTSFK